MPFEVAPCAVCNHVNLLYGPMFFFTKNIINTAGSYSFPRPPINREFVGEIVVKKPPINNAISCATDPCHEGVNCTDTDAGYVCGTCPEGFTGKTTLQIEF